MKIPDKNIAVTVVGGGIPEWEPPVCLPWTKGERM